MAAALPFTGDCGTLFERTDAGDPDNLYSFESTPSGVEAIAIGAWQDMGEPLGQGTVISPALILATLAGAN